MIHTTFDGDALDAEIEQALYDCRETIAELRRTTRHAINLQRGTRDWHSNAGYAEELLDIIQCRAARIELPDGPLTADALLKFANARDRRAARQPDSARRPSSRALHEAYLQSLTAERAAITALTAAEAARESARQQRIAAERAYSDHGASRLVK